jgi:hypothetical protein
MAGERREDKEDKVVRQDVRGGTPGAGAGRAGGPGTRGAGLGEEGSNAGEVDPGVALSGETLEGGGPGLVRSAGEGERDVPTSPDTVAG